MNFNMSRRALKGFTLSEILVVIVLLPLVTGAVYSFFSIGVRTHQRSQQLSMFNASTRMAQKLISEKLERRSDRNYSVFMRKDGFLKLAPVISDIMKQPVSGVNNKLYQALGFSNFAYHQLTAIENCTSETVIKKFAEKGFIYNDDLTGPYIYEVAKKEEMVSEKLYNLGFDIKPAGFIGGSFLERTDSVLLTVAPSPATIEINFPARVLKNMSPLLKSETVSDGKAFFTLTVNKGSAALRNAFDLFFSFDSKQPPVASLAGGFTEGAVKKYFVVSANIFCDDGMIFYEEDTSGAVINHAIYVSDGPPEDILYDDYGKKLRQLRYSIGKNNAGQWICLDDVLIGGVSAAVFSYYNAAGAEIKCDNDAWKWHKGNEISKIVIELIVDNAGYYVPTRLVFDL